MIKIKVDYEKAVGKPDNLPNVEDG